jgi:hypothetical protein
MGQHVIQGFVHGEIVLDGQQLLVVRHHFSTREQIVGIQIILNVFLPRNDLEQIQI